MADFPYIPVDVTAKDIEKRVNLPIDTKATSGSKNLITSGAVFDATNDKLPIVPATIRMFSDLNSLFSNSVYDVTKVVFDISVSSLGEVSQAVGGSATFWGSISNNTLILNNKESGKRYTYENGSSELHLLDKDYWEKSVTTEQITGAETLFNIVGLANGDGTISFVNVRIYVADLDTTIEGFCYAIGVGFKTGDTVYLINVTDGSMWKINRYNEGDEFVILYKFHYEKLSTDFSDIPDGSIADEKLENKYWKRNVGVPTAGSNSLFASFLRDDSLSIFNLSATAYPDMGKGPFVAYPKGDNTYSLFNLSNSELWSVIKGENGELSIEFSGSQTSVDQTYNPESENAQSGKAVAEALNSVDSLTDISFTAGFQVENYGFEWGKLYFVKFGGSVPLNLTSGSDELPKGRCLACYNAEYSKLYGQTIDRKLLKLLDLDDLTCGVLDYTNWVYKKISSLKSDSDLSNTSETLVFEHKWENHIAHTVTAIDFENFTMTLDDTTGIPTDTSGENQNYFQLDMFGGNAILMNVMPIELIRENFKVQAIGDNKVQFLDNSNTVIQFTDTGNIDLTKFKLCVLDKPFSQVNVDNLDTNHKYHVVFDFEGYHHFTAGIKLPECVTGFDNGYKIIGIKSSSANGYMCTFNTYSDTISFRGALEIANGGVTGTLPAKLDVYITPELYNGQKRALLEIKGVYYSHNNTKYNIESYCIYANGWANNAISKIGFGTGNLNWHGNAKARIYDCGEVDLW